MIGTPQPSRISFSRVRSPDRSRLAELLLASLEGRDTDAEALWDAEIARRATELATGRVAGIAGIAAADVFAEVESRLHQYSLSAIPRRAMHFGSGVGFPHATCRYGSDDHAS